MSKATINWNEVIWDDAAFSSLDWWKSNSRGIVRQTKAGDFVLIELDGGERHFIKRFDNLQHARAYNFACAQARS